MPEDVRVGVPSSSTLTSTDDALQALPSSPERGGALLARELPRNGVRSRRQRWRLPLMVAVPILAALAGGYFYVVTSRYVSTDDAFVQADRVEVSADVSGRVVAVDVHDNQPVRAGQILFRLDDRPFTIAERQARAQLVSARLRVQEMKAAYRQKGAELGAARATLAFRHTDYDRQKRLLAASVGSQAAFDQAASALAVAEQQVASLEQQGAGILADLNNDANIPVDSHPSVQQAQAVLDRALLDLSYAVVTASVDGIVTKVDQLQVGDYVTVARPVFSLVATGHLWIEANFKETDLTHMRPGQLARVEIDAYPDHDFTARVASVSPGTGSTFALLPPENATGNWVKVVQRLPVRLELDNPAGVTRLHAGLSADVEVDTHYRPRIVSPILDAIFGAGNGAASP